MRSRWVRTRSIAFNDDPTYHKHGGTDTSNAAWHRARRGMVKSQLAVIEALQKVHPHGLIGKEIAYAIGKPFNAVSGRITELLEQGLVRKGAHGGDLLRRSLPDRRGGGCLKLPRGQPLTIKQYAPQIQGEFMAGPATNRVQDTIYDESGSPINGTVSVTTPAAFFSQDGFYIPQGTTNPSQIVNGVIDIPLVISPAGQQYLVIYEVSDQQYTEKWVMPASPSPCKLSNVIVL